MRYRVKKLPELMDFLTFIERNFWVGGRSLKVGLAEKQRDIACKKRERVEVPYT
jgi:hypothetical protein